MRSDLTDITLVVDRSGSMQVIQADAEGGVNAFIEKQAAEPGEAAVNAGPVRHRIRFRSQRCANRPGFEI